MNRQYLLKGVLALAFLALFSQCGMRTVTMRAMRPADITFPSYVKNLLLLDRTKFDRQGVNILEGILTGETPGQDKAGLQELMASFQNTIQTSPRFQVRQATEILTGNSITSAFPDALSWTQIEELCKRYNTEAVVSVEIFDTDFVVTNGKRRVKKVVEESSGTKKEVEVDEYYAQGVANVVIGIRLYNPREKTIIDQELFKRGNTWEAKGSNLTDAAGLLISKAEATRYVSGLAGKNYAYKIAPMPISIRREFYSKSRKAPQIPAGSRKADVNDWQGAIDTWQNGLQSAPAKQAGRLCYNIAVAHEVLGDLDAAHQYASKAWVDYGNKKGREYSRILNRRMREVERLRMQTAQ